jgi:hypothetical protein
MLSVAKHLLFLVENKQKADPSPACGIGMTSSEAFSSACWESK